MIDFEKLKKEFGLPNLEDIAERFELVLKKDDEEMSLQTIRNDITEKVFDVSKTIEAMIFPREGGDPDMLHIEKMIEGMTEDCYALYKELNSIYSKGIRLRFEHNRKEDAEFIKAVFAKWPQIEESLKKIFKTIEDGWKTIKISEDPKEEIYHG
ncbi:MAG TPA: hypothetical protein VJA47_06560 [archaeon]|nr:hypothetical protein [archaeon]